MSIEKIHVTIIKSNPFEEQIRNKVSALEAFQTPRIAKEFFDTIYGTFALVNNSLTRPWFIEHKYILFTQDNENESLALTLEAQGRYIAHYQRIFLEESTEKQKDVLVTTDFAYKIPSLFEDIAIGRTRPKERIPMFLTIDNKNYPLVR